MRSSAIPACEYLEAPGLLSEARTSRFWPFLGAEQAQGGLIQAGNDLATRESLERKLRIITVMEKGIRRFERLGGERDFHPSERLRQRQQRALHHLLRLQRFRNQFAWARCNRQEKSANRSVHSPVYRRQ